MIRKILERVRSWFGMIDETILFNYSSLLASANNVFTTSSQKNEFHLKTLEFFKDLIRVDDAYTVYYHLRKKGLHWQHAGNDRLCQILATGQLQKLADQNVTYTLTEDLDLVKEVSEQARQSFSKGLLFQFFDYYDYLILYHDRTGRQDGLMKFMDAMAGEIKNRLYLKSSYQDLQQKLTKLEKSIAGKDIELRKLDKSLKKRVYEIHNLLEISNELYSILNLKRLINSALLIIMGQVGCQRAFALLFDPNDRKFSKKFLKGCDPEELEELSVDVDHPLINYFARNPRPFLVEELLGEEGLKFLGELLLDHQFEVIAPIFHSERVRGIIGCGDQLYNQSFDQSENDIFNILVNIISISVFNAQTFEDVRTLALTDAMTNLHNYRYFEDRLKEEINRGRRSGTCVSIIMLDIDHFKNYNDTLGHQAGDEALRTLGWILKNTVREEDIVNRYGGEEFCIILPGLEKKVISVLGDRIRQKVEDFPFLKENVQPGGSLTISLGASTFPEDADNFEDLVYKADQALYQSKNSGRNRLTIYNYTN